MPCADEHVSRARVGLKPHQAVVRGPEYTVLVKLSQRRKRRIKDVSDGLGRHELLQEFSGQDSNVADTGESHEARGALDSAFVKPDDLQRHTA